MTGPISQPFPFAYGCTTTSNPWETIVPDYCEGPDILYADGVLHAGTPAWIPRRLADLRAIYNDQEHFSNAGMAPFAPLLGEDCSVLPLEADAPAHARYRAALNPSFGPKAVAQLDAKMRLAAKHYAGGMREQGACDFLAAFAFLFPIRVFLDLMGMPQDMLQQFLEWEHGLLHSFDLQTLCKATRDVSAYLRGAIDDRKLQPRDDLISRVVAARIDGEPLSDNEFLGLFFNLFIGGLDSVSSNMSWQIFHLATHPEDQHFLRANPGMIATAIDEMQRYYAAITTYRRCIKFYKIADVTISPGEFVGISTTVAGRDDHEYANPNVVSLNRRPRHVSFGYGQHTCVGANLARREMRIALEEILSVLPAFYLKPKTTICTMLHSTLQPDILPIA